MFRLVTVLGLMVVGCGPSTYDRDRCILYGRDCPKRTLQVYETIINEASEPGQDGTDGRDGQDGKDGEDGIDGLPGLDGLDGSSCTVVQTNTGALITCEDGSSAEILHGIDGIDGQDGTNGQDGQDAPVNPFQITEVIDPCGKQSSFDEVILRMANGQLVAYFASHGGFLAILGPGNYVTTDGTNCKFKIHADLTITW